MNFHKGQIIEHLNTKTIFESDNNLHCLLTMNNHPVHTNIEYASRAKHKEILVCGTYVLSLVVGITVPEISFNAIANLCYNNITHLNPVFIGDTIHVKSKIIDIIKQKTTNVIVIESIAFNQNNKPVLNLERKMLI